MNPELDVQHPLNDDGTWMLHCCQCGTYVDDTEYEPAVDWVCDDCIETALAPVGES